MGRLGTVRIGTSGWSYPHWRGLFYPADLPAAEHLAFYATRFSTVELDNTFYHLPSAGAVRQWGRIGPPGFVFAAKASRFLTHMKRLKPERAPVRRFFGRVVLLGPQLGPILFQLPRTAHANAERLAAFLAILPGRRRYAFEFRHPSWFAEPIYRILRRRRAALCVTDTRGIIAPEAQTAGFLYLRFHGAATRGGRYGEAALAAWAGRITRARRAGCDVYAYFNNDAHGHAITNAERLRALCEA